MQFDRETFINQKGNYQEIPYLQFKPSDIDFRAASNIGHKDKYKIKTIHNYIKEHHFVEIFNEK